MLTGSDRSGTVKTLPRSKGGFTTCRGRRQHRPASLPEHSIQVTHTPGVLTDATADLTFALILSLSRRLMEGDRLVRRGASRAGRQPFLWVRSLKENTSAFSATAA